MTGSRQLAVAVALVLGCGGSSSRPPTGAGIKEAPRAPTAADAVLRYLPAGADLVVEIDLKRVRGNAVVGAAVTQWLQAYAGAQDERPAAGQGGHSATKAPIAVDDLARAPLVTADAIVLAAYGVGGEGAATATLIVGDQPVAGAVPLAPRIVVLAPPPLARRAEATTAGAEPSLASDAELLALRARAMPTKAAGASLRVAARLDFDARVALASLTGGDAAPRALSLWADVVDDAALVVELDGADGTDGGARLEAALDGLRDRLATSPPVRAAGLTPPLRRVRIERSGDHLRVVGVVGPKRLRKAVAIAAPKPNPDPRPQPGPNPQPDPPPSP